jgi:hypothetical protein
MKKTISIRVKSHARKASKADITTKSPANQLTGFMAKYDPAIEKLAKKMLAKLRTLIPGAVEMVYDNYNALVIGFGATEKVSEAIISLVLYPDHISLCFLWGKKLADPDKILQGDGNQVRFIRLPEISTLDDPKVGAMIARAIANSAQPFSGRRKMVIKSISAKQKPRRKAK